MDATTSKLAADVYLLHPYHHGAGVGGGTAIVSGSPTMRAMTVR
ncbi:hypothetical protein I549_0475 [Mycobacterium avium subsp. avium 2285 (R)]|nr:hypothetical protein I549_0475 [Mycobacterium avium subsp. avium 2285 (R)]